MTHVILVATDFTAASNLAVQQAWQLATQREDAELHILHVAEEGEPMTKRTRLIHREQVLTTLPPKMKNHAIRLVQRLSLAPLHRAFAVHVRFGNAAHEILALAQELDAAMVVVGSHDRGGVGRFFMGSVADQVVHAGVLPVLVSRPKRLPASVERSEAPEPPCPDCVETQRTTGELWCESHARPHVRPHWYAGNRDSTHPSFSAGSYR